MKRLAMPLLFLVAACGSGGGETLVGTLGDETAETQTLGDRLGDCFTRDATDLGSLLETLSGFLGDSGDEIPQPDIDLAGILTNGGALPLTWDLDGDGTPEIDAVIRFINEQGNTTLPFTLGDLANLDPDNPLSLLDSVPDGSRMELRFMLTGQLAAGGADGTLILTFNAGVPSHVEGTGRFEGDGCGIDFDLDRIPIALDGLDSLPEIGFGFSAGIDPDLITGRIDFDGTDLATVRGRINDGLEETFSFNLSDLDRRR